MLHALVGEIFRYCTLRSGNSLEQARCRDWMDKSLFSISSFKNDFSCDKMIFHNRVLSQWISLPKK
jgi:hypothetical protein